MPEVYILYIPKVQDSDKFIAEKSAEFIEGSHLTFKSSILYTDTPGDSRFLLYASVRGQLCK